MDEYKGCMACYPNHHIAAIVVRAEQAERQAEYLLAREASLSGELSGTKARAEQAEREVARLREALRDVCIGHNDECDCRGCAIAFRAALEGGGR